MLVKLNCLSWLNVSIKSINNMELTKSCPVVKNFNYF